MSSVCHLRTVTLNLRLKTGVFCPFVRALKISRQFSLQDAPVLLSHKRLLTTSTKVFDREADDVSYYVVFTIRDHAKALKFVTVFS